MGMFDSLVDDRGRDWQTKAYGCVLARYLIGSTLPGVQADYQVEVLGTDDSFATIEGGVLRKVPDERIPILPLMDYFGAWKDDDD